MLLVVRHLTRMRYVEGTTGLALRLRLFPQNFDGQRVIDWHVEVDGDEIVRTIVEEAFECRQATETEGHIEAIAAAVPATVSVEKGILMKSPNVPCLDGFRMVAALENELNIKAVIENDANAAAVGENWLGASRGCKNSIMVTLGTGVGGGTDRRSGPVQPHQRIDRRRRRRRIADHRRPPPPVGGAGR